MYLQHLLLPRNILKTVKTLILLWICVDSHLQGTRLIKLNTHNTSPIDLMKFYHWQMYPQYQKYLLFPPLLFQVHTLLPQIMQPCWFYWLQMRLYLQVLWLFMKFHLEVWFCLTVIINHRKVLKKSCRKLQLQVKVGILETKQVSLNLYHLIRSKGKYTCLFLTIKVLSQTQVHEIIYRATH